MRACLCWQWIGHILPPLLFLGTNCISFCWGRGPDFMEREILVAPGDLQFPGTTTVWPAEGNSEPAMTDRTSLSKLLGHPPCYSTHPRCLAIGSSPMPNNTLRSSFRAVRSICYLEKSFLPKVFFYIIPSNTYNMHTHSYTHTHIHTHPTH